METFILNFRRNLGYLVILIKILGYFRNFRRKTFFFRNFRNFRSCGHPALVFFSNFGVHKQSKVTEPDFSGKFSVVQQKGGNGLKYPRIGFLEICGKLSH